MYMAYMLVMENRSFDLSKLLKELLLDNIKMTKDKNYAFSVWVIACEFSHVLFRILFDKR